MIDTEASKIDGDALNCRSEQVLFGTKLPAARLIERGFRKSVQGARFVST